MRRSAVFVPGNLSEGAARKSDKELNNFLSISLGSLAELETQLLIASRLGYANVEAVLGRVNRVRALILGLRNHVRRKKRETWSVKRVVIRTSRSVFAGRLSYYYFGAIVQS